MVLLRLFTYFFAFSMTWTALAEVQMFSSKVWRRARLFSVGQQVWSFQSSYQKSNRRFDQDGIPQALGQKFGRAVTWGELVNSESEEDRAELRNYMRQRGLRDDSVAATANYQLEREDLSFRVDWAYGLTKKWMIGFQVPLTYRTTRVSTKIGMVPELASGARQSGGRQRNSKQMREKVRELSEREIMNSGYDAVPDQKTSWEWGDVTLLSQVAVVNRYRWSWALQQMVRFPTARNPSLDDYFQQETDEGQVDVGFTSLTDYRYKLWTLGARVSVVGQMPDTVRKRTSDSEASGGGRNIDPAVSRDLGDYLILTGDVEYRLNRKWNLSFEHSYLAKGRDRFKGQSLAGTPYANLGAQTEERLHQSRLEVLYHFGLNGARSGITNQWMASLGHSHPWMGKNRAEGDRTSLELISYF